ncbi:glycoside hydrolase family 47 protein [Xylariomycetidae sp. FL0641]|nr:glycoside hydrolase family 47 protein [Xylariomycetidae sp. FL0641]
MLVPEDVALAWHSDQWLHASAIMAALFRSKIRVLAALSLVALVYLLYGLVPENREVLFGYTFVHDSYNYANRKFQYPITSYTPLPTGTPLSLPKIQYDFKIDDSEEGRARQEMLATRREEVKAAFVKSWDSYKAVGVVYDEVQPVSGDGYDEPGLGGWGATLVDSLTALWLMDLKDEFHEAVAAAVTIDYAESYQTSVNFFEISIRHLGGLLSAFDLSGESALLLKAVELGDFLYQAYDTPNHMPGFWLNFRASRKGGQVAGNRDPSASITSQSMEFTRLSQLTGDPKYYDAINRVTDLLIEWQYNTSLPGMWPSYLDFRQEQLNSDNTYTVGANADSLYEYFAKTFTMLGGLEPKYEALYRGSMDTVVKHLLFRPMTTDQADILFAGNSYVSSTFGAHLTAEVQHLGCFAGGMFGLGGKLFDIPEHVEYAEKLTKGCVWAYEAFPSGIMPEISHMTACDSFDPCPWDESDWALSSDLTLPKGFMDASDPRYLLRPEAVESVFWMYRITGNEEYQDMAWRMFEAVRNSTETELGFSSISSVRANQNETDKIDSMQSFWLGETLPYIYLTLASPDLANLDEFMPNTEAHFFKRPGVGNIRH